MITETGGNLSVLIITEPGLDWQAFGTWYSFYKNLPDAKVHVNVLRNGDMPFAYYQWAKRLKLPLVHHKPYSDNLTMVNWLDAINKANLTSDILVVKPLVMATDIFEPEILDKLNAVERWIDDDVWFLKEPNIHGMINDFFLEDKKLENSEEKLCHEAKEINDPACLVSYQKGCGKWINTAKGCPFSNAGGLVTADMTVNEHRIIDLWKKMVPLYNAVS